MIKDKFKLLKIYKKCPSEFNKLNLKVMEDIVRHEIKKFNNNCWQTFLNKQGKNPLSSTPFWRKINMFRNKKTSNEIPTLVNGDVELSSAEDKACAFAKKLANTFSETPISESDKFLTSEK